MISLSFPNNERRKQNVEAQVMHQKFIESHLGFKTSVQSLKPQSKLYLENKLTNSQ